LVDATRSAFIALWFTVNDCKDKPGLLMGVHSAFLAGYEMQTQMESYSEVFKERDKSWIETWQPTNVSPRIAAQHSQYLYSPIAASKLGSLYLPLGNQETLFIAIGPKQKSEFEQILEESHDIRIQTLFPDLDGFCNAHAENVSSSSMYRW
jgi:hypothetical protein